MPIQIFCSKKWDISILCRCSSNGQIERAHSTLTEIARCIKYELNLIDCSEIIIKAAQKYNLTIHSITNQRPLDILFNKIKHEDMPKLLQQAQEKMLHFHNKDRQNKPKS